VGFLKAMRVRTVFLVVLAVLILVPLGAVAYLLTLGSYDLKQLIVDRVATQTGRQLAINGPFELELSLTPSLSAGDVTFQNAEWGSRPEMARIGLAEIEIDLVPLFTGTLDVTRILLKDADILIETDASGRSNLDFGKAAPTLPSEEPAPSPPAGATPPGPPPAPSIPVIRHADFEDVTVVLKDQVSGAVRTLHVAEVDIDGVGAQTPLDVSMVGDFDRVAFEVVGQLGSPAQMLTPTEAWPLSLVGSAGGISLDIAGTMAEPTAARGLDIAVQARGPEIAALGHLLGTEIPEAGSFRVVVTLLGDLDGMLALKEIDAELGATDAMSLTARGDIGSVFEGTGVDLVVAARGTALESLAVALGRQIPAVGPYDGRATVRGDLYGALSVSDLEVALGANESVRLEARGGIDSALEGRGIALELSARGPEWGALREILPDGLGPVTFADLGPFDVAATVRGDVDGTLAVEGITAELGAAETIYLTATGAVASAMDGGGIDIAGEVKGQALNDLLALIPPDLFAAPDDLPPLGPFRVGLTARGDVRGELSLSGIDAEIGRPEFVSLKTQGAVGSVMDGSGLDLRLHAVGTELGDLNNVLGSLTGQDLSMPALGPFDVVAGIRGDIAGVLSIAELDGQLGARRTVLVTARGGIEDLRGRSGIDLDARVQGWELGRLNELIPPAMRGDTDVPALGPYDVAGRVSGDLDGVLSVAGLQAAIGTEDSALFTAEGDVGNVFAVKDLALTMAGRGRSLAVLSPVLGFDLPAAGPFDAVATVAGSLDDALTLSGLQAAVGESTASGDLSVDFTGPRPALRATVESRRLDLDALRGLASVDPTLTPQAGPAVPAAAAPAVSPVAPAQGTAPAVRDAYQRLFPAEPLPVGNLQVLDVDAEIQAAELIIDGQRMDSVRAKVTLTNGKLVLDPLQGGLGGGLVSGTVTLDASVPEPSLAGQLAIQQYDIGSLLAAHRILQGFRGRADINLAGLSSQGGSIRDLMANLNGTVSIRMGSGRMDAREVNRLSGGAADLARLLLGGGRVREMTVNCMDLRYAVTDGVMRTEKMLFDTDIVTVMGDGEANLRSEELDMFVGARPKASGIAPQVAMKIRGTFANPDYDIDKSSTVGAAGGLILSELLGTAVPGSSALSGLIDTLSGGAAFPCQGVPGASNVRAADRQPAEQPKQEETGKDKDRLEEKLDKFLQGILGQ